MRAEEIRTRAVGTKEARTRLVGTREAEGRREAATREARTREVGTREDNRVKGKSRASSKASHYSGLEFVFY
jgi:hypothetical protein